MSKTTRQAKRFIEETRASIDDEDICHDMTQTEWCQLVERLCKLAEEYIWLREESES